MKVLYISNFKNISGWSTQAVNHIMALQKAGVDVIPRHINILNNINPDLPEELLSLEKKDCKNPDVVLLNTLPSFYEYTGWSKTVGYYVCETSKFRNSGWSHRINLMKAGIVPCYHNKQASLNSGVTVPIHIVPECINMDKYSKTYPIHQVRSTHKDKFLFLTIGEWTQRKNMEAVIRAFHMEFSPQEPVELVIKTTPANLSNPQAEINGRIESIKKGMKLYNNIDKYKNENVYCSFFSETEIYSLMQSCDAVVNTSRGEAFCIPVVDALGFGKPVISCDHSGLDYLNDKNAFIVRSTETPCFGATDTLQELYSSDETWFECDIISLREQMRSAYEKKSLATKKVQAGRETVKRFSYEVVGKTYKDVLEKI